MLHEQQISETYYYLGFNFQMGTKTTKECIQFYYLWKKICPDEHKRLRLIRRRREQDRLYNLRSTSAQQQLPAVQPAPQPSHGPGLDSEAPPSEQVVNYEEYDEMESESGASTEVEEQNDNVRSINVCCLLWCWHAIVRNRTIMYALYMYVVFYGVGMLLLMA